MIENIQEAPFFSVVVPSYNRAEFLSHTIHSVLQQNFTDFELLIIDDGSKDNTKEVIIQLMHGDARIRYIYQQNAERGAARNNGIRNANGRYIVFFDSDDEMKPKYLEHLFAAIERNPNGNIFAAKYNFISGGNEYNSSTTDLKEGFYDKYIILKGNPFACNFCIKKDQPALIFFEEDRNLATTEDWMFLVENLYCNKIYLIDEIGILMHQHEGRSMQQNQLLITRRLNATELLCNRICFAPNENKMLWAYTYHFCSIHSYLDYKEQDAIAFLKKAVNLIGWNKDFIVSFIKYKVGRSLIEKVKLKILH